MNTKVTIYVSIILLLSFIINSCVSTKETAQKPYKHKKGLFVIAIHGGAGNITPENTDKETKQKYQEKLTEALDTGIVMLYMGKTAVDVVERVIMILEDSPLFNAGKGAVFTNKGINELDASIMDGSTLNAGAVAGVKDIKNPISAAKQVLLNSEHVMLSGDGASQFAKEKGLEIVPASYFFTERSWEALKKARKKEKPEKHGTVGCVVLDTYGNLAAGTSTGGRTNKKYGRIGDSPVIGAGTYADNNTCAVSCTGHGEFFIRKVVAHDLSAMIQYKKMDIKQAANLIINDKLQKIEGYGGLIALDRKGNVAMTFNTRGMFRGYAKSDGTKEVSMFK